LNASSPTQPKPVAPTVTARFKSALARLIGANPVDKSGNSEPTPTVTPVEAIWSLDWCAQEPELASMAIATLQDRVQTLEDYIKFREWGEHTLGAVIVLLHSNLVPLASHVQHIKELGIQPAA